MAIHRPQSEQMEIFNGPGDGLGVREGSEEQKLNQAQNKRSHVGLLTPSLYDTA
jgi:hypothetical protein